MFIGNKETQKAAAQAVIESTAHLSRATESLKRLVILVNGDDSERVRDMSNFVDAYFHRLHDLFSEDCRNAFMEE